MSERREFRDLATQEAAHETIDRLDLDPDPETVPIESATGRVLAERVDATIDVPGFDRAGMDGYAVRAEDTYGADEMNPTALSVIGSVHAGEEPGISVETDTAVEISTGAVLPPGGTAVVPVERTTEHEETVEVQTSVAPGDSIMTAGADVAAGERVLGPGTILTAREVGVLSALGHETVPVRGRPTVGIISTGDELVRPGEDLDHDRGQIYDVNSYTVASAVREAGGEPEVYPHVGDDMEAMESVLTEAAEECDLVLSSGSTSASAVDVIYRVIEENGELLLHGVSVKPGKPMLVGRIGEAAFVGLPGFPVSALTIFRVFVAPAIRDAASLPEPPTATVEGTMAVQERYSEGRTRFMPVGLVTDGSGNTLVYPVDKGSGATTSLVDADGVVEVDADTEYLDRGESVVVKRFSADVRTPSLLGVGEDDPALSRLLDHLDRPRYLGEGTREAVRRLREDVPDVGVVTGPLTNEATGVGIDTWTREWGLVVPDGNPEDVSDVEDLIDGDLTFRNRHRNAGLRASFDEVLETIAGERNANRSTLTDAIDGYEFTLRAHESPARRVKSGEADVGLGLRATAVSLDLGFVPVGTETVTVFANESRVDKPGVTALESVLETHLDSVLEELPGYGQ
ncbi:MAG: molybdopterin biosynthesis protein [Halodesulfurarchaeum sp.]